MKLRLNKISLGGTRSTPPPGNVRSSMTTAHPGLILVIIDQSSSMAKPWGDRQEARMSVAASYVNQMIHEVILDSSEGGERGKRVFMAIFGYSQEFDDKSGDGAFRELICGWPHELESRSPDETWVQPQASGHTPMRFAFEGARQWLKEIAFRDKTLRDRFRDSAPVVIVHITDGEATEYRSDTEKFAPPDYNEIGRSVQELWRMPLPNGLPPLLFHVHISGKNTEKVVLPSDDAKLDPFGKELFKLASEIPSNWLEGVSDSTFGVPIEPGAVGLIMNSEPKDLIKFLQFASRSWMQDVPAED